MPKKNSIINNTPPQEKILIEDEETQQPELTKPKRQISDAQREHLNNIRSKALEKKAEMKEESLKAKPWTEASAGVTDRDLACPQFRRN